MELKSTLNVLAAVTSFVFIVAVIFGMA